MHSEKADPDTELLGAVAARGVLWTVAERIWGRLLGFALLAVLARLLTPENFGLIALALAVLAFAEIGAGQGLAEALIQAPEEDDARQCTAFWINLAGGVCLCAGVAALAVPLASWLGQPHLRPVVQALALSLVLASAGAVPQALLRKRLAFRTLALQDVASSFAGGAAAIALALAGFGVWSLVAQTLVAAAVWALLPWFSISWRPRPAFSLQRARELWAFGASVVGTRLANFAARRADDLIVGLALGTAALGFYSLAYRVVLALSWIVLGPLSAVAFPVLARVSDNRERLAGAYGFLVFGSCAVAFPAFAGASLYAPELTRLLYGPGWEPVGDLLRILALIGFVHGIAYHVDAALFAAGKSRTVLILKTTNATAGVIAFLMAAPWGLEAVAMAFVIRGALMTPFFLRVLRRATGMAAGTSLRAAFEPALGVGAMGAVLIPLRWALDADQEPLLSLAIAPLGAVVYALVLWQLAPQGTRRLCSTLAGAWRVRTRSEAAL